MTPVEAEPFRYSYRACKLLFCSFQDDRYKGLEETVQIGSGLHWAKSFWEHSWEPLILWRDSSKRQHWDWDACPDYKLCRNFCTADKPCTGPCKVYTFCNNTYRLSEMSLGQQPLIYSTCELCPLCPLLPHWAYGLTMRIIWGIACRFPPSLLPPPPPHPRHTFLTSRGKQRGSRIRGLYDKWWRLCKEYILLYKL